MNKDPYSEMDKEAYRIAYLIAGYIRNNLTDKEHRELNDWVNASDHNMLLFEDLTDERNIDANLKWMDEVQARESYKRLQESGAFEKPPRKRRLAWVAAASIVLVAGVWIVYRETSGSNREKSNITQADTINLHPGGNRATLTLAGGEVIDLTTAKNGTIKTGVGSHVSKPADGELVYEAGPSQDTGLDFHTLSTPVGGQYQVILQDGTKVWLNAASRLRFPAHFARDERRVELEGEAYFEVVKDEQHPFRVTLHDSITVTVMGTHFNVMAYSNEPGKEITLVEGRVAVKAPGGEQLLDPGTQARVRANGVTRISNVDTEQVTGWKNGYFLFHNASIESIMRQVERWYDAQVVYRGDIKQEFNATILRSEPLPRLLHLLELNGYVKFRIENKTIYVLP
jgi:ferric-dicitrate binding protein FerR (iron transport regulator)